MKRKLLTLVLALAMICSLCGAITLVSADTTDDTNVAFVLGDAFEPASNSAVEIENTQLTDGEEHDFSTKNASKIILKLASGKTYNPSHIRSVTSRKRFKLYFLGSGYNFASATKGDLLTIQAGFSIDSNAGTFVVEEDINYIYTGSEWIKGTVLPSYTAFELGGVTTCGGTQIEMSNTQLNDIGDDGEADLNVENKDAIVMTGANGTTYAPSHIRFVAGRKTFKLYFNTQRYDFGASAKGDILTIGKGLVINSSAGKFVVENDISYIYTGSEWLKGNKIITPTEIYRETGSYNRFAVTLEGAETLNQAVTNPLAVGHVTITTVDGQTVTPTHLYSKNNSIVIFALNMIRDGFNSFLRGDIITVTKGCGYNAGEVVAEDVSFIYTGTEWILGSSLPSDDAVPNGIVLAASEINAYIGEDYVLPEVRYTYEDTSLAQTKVDDDKIIVEGTVDKNTIGSYDLTIKVLKTDSTDEYFTATLKVNVIDFDTITVKAIHIHPGWSRFLVEFTTTNQANDSNTNRPDFIPYFSYIRNGSELTINSCVVLGSNQGYEVRENGVNIINDVKVGDVIVIKEGLKFLANEKVKATEYFIYNGTAFVKFTKPTEITASDTKVYEGKTVNVNFGVTPECATSMLSYSISGDAAIESVNGYTVVVKGTKIGTATLTATFMDVTKSVTITVEEEPVLTSIEITGKVSVTRFDSSIDLSSLIAKRVYSIGDPVEFTLDESMLTYPEGYNLDVAGSYTVTATVDGKTATFVVEVADVEELTVKDVLLSADWHSLRVDFNTKNKGNYTGGVSAEVLAKLRANILNYIEISRKVNPTATWQGNTPYVMSGQVILFVQDVTEKDYSVGDTVTLKKGLSIIDGERLYKTVTYVYNGSVWVELVEPEDFSIAKTVPSEVTVGSVTKIDVTAAEGVTAVYKYSVDNEEVATIDEYGNLNALSVGTVVVTVSYKDILRQVTIEVKAEPEKTGIVLDTDYSEYMIAVQDAESTLKFSDVFTLKYHYTYKNNTVSKQMEVPAEAYGALDLTTAGIKDLVVTINGFTATLKVNVYALKNVDSFNSLGVSGYDVNDSKNVEGTWNGHMIIGIAKYMTNTANLLSTDECETLSTFIEYRVSANGKTYYGYNKDEENIDRIGVWMLGTNLLIMIKPEGADGNYGYAVEDRWTSSEHPYAPIYQLGDKITFRKGMPLYKWVGEKNGNYPVAGKGYTIVEGVLSENITYYCYLADEEKSMWQLYKEYTDFNLAEEKTMSVGETGSVGAVRVPFDATLGQFTYVSSDPDVVFVNASGNLIAMKVGTATITVTLKGGKDADGKDMADITKTMVVHVVKKVDSVEGSYRIKKDSTVNYGDYKVKVTFSDGSVKEIALDDENIVVEEFDTTTVGKTSYNIIGEADGISFRGTVEVEIYDGSGNCGGNCKSNIGNSLPVAFVTLIALAVVTVIKRKNND